MSGGEVVIVTEGGGDDEGLVRGLVDAMEELSQPGAGSLEAGGSIGSSLNRAVDESPNQDTFIFRVSDE